ncbi:MAG: hypothetical protein DWI03_07785 [Planctomycetota bacterium]|nr:MAG: hypothetical protein DWI03_07785 [Planctomycetota bacterium]
MSDGFQEGRRRVPGVSLAALLPRSRFIACDDILATAVQDDADRCRPGDVFVARLTARGDGHDAVSRALARGAVAVIAERMVPTEGTGLCLVHDSDFALTRLAQALAGEPSHHMRVIAVTGTSGKTTTAWLTAAVLAEAGLRVGVLSDLGCLSADDALPEADDYSRPATLAAWLARLADDDCSHAVVEVSSEMLAAQALAGVRCDTVVVTNLARARLATHGAARAHRDLCRRATEALAPGGCLVAGRPAARHGLLDGADATATCLTAGLTADCDVWARPVEGSLWGRTFLLGCGGQRVPVAVDNPVRPFVRNATLAAAVGARYGVSLERAARGLEAAGSVPGRVERIDCGQDAAVFVDAPTSPHALAGTLGSLRRLTRGRLVVLAEKRLAHHLGGRGFGRRVARWCDGCELVPDTILDVAADAQALACYARIDGLLSGLGQDDCLLVAGGLRRGRRARGPAAGRFPLAELVQGWLRLAHPAARPGTRLPAA